MITLFTIPKPFKGHIGAIQRNALRSWSLLQRDSRVVLLGDEEGTAEAAEAVGAVHIPEIARNSYGTPLLHDVFAKGEGAGEGELLCYVNADIVLMDSFIRTVQTISTRKRQFLMIGRRSDLDLNPSEELDFSDGWQDRLKQRVDRGGRLQGPTHIDYFIYPRGIWGKIPPFAVGRFAWDNWLIWRARMRRVPVIDASQSITAVHQNHDYHHASGGYKGARFGPEARGNLALAGGNDHLFTIWDSTHLVSDEGLCQRKQDNLGGGIWSYRRSIRLGA